MPMRPATFRPRGVQPKRERERDYDRRRGSAAARGYDAEWQRARLLFLAEHPLCVRCAAVGRIVAATIVDHKLPHRGDPVLFWDRDNWQPLCKPHHDRDKQREERVTPL